MKTCKYSLRMVGHEHCRDRKRETKVAAYVPSFPCYCSFEFFSTFSFISVNAYREMNGCNFQQGRNRKFGPETDHGREAEQKRWPLENRAKNYEYSETERPVKCPSFLFCFPWTNVSWSGVINRFTVNNLPRWCRLSGRTSIENCDFVTVS